jgi:hypothetical protein
MSSAVAEYAKIVDRLSTKEGIGVGQMFGKPCIKVKGKAFISQHKDSVIFQLCGAPHQAARSLSGAVLWDPSGTGRPMKEWVALPAAECGHFALFADAAYEYVSAKT